MNSVLKICSALKCPVLEDSGDQTDYDGLSSTIPLSGLGEGTAAHAHAVLAQSARAFLAAKNSSNPLALVNMPRLPLLTRIVRRRSSAVLCYAVPEQLSQAHSLREAVDEDRRLSARNTLRWTQQLLTSVCALHANYVVLRSLSLEDVSLCAEDDFLRDQHRERESERTERARLAARETERLTAVGSESKPEPRQAWLQLKPFLDVRFFAELRDCDKMLSGSCSSKLDEDALRGSDLFQQYQEFCATLQQNLRCVGVIVLQLLQRRTFSPTEVSDWMKWKPSSSELADVDATRGVSREQLSLVAQKLRSVCPYIVSAERAFTELLAICFFGSLSPLIESKQSRKTNTTSTMRFPAWKAIKAVVNRLENLSADDVQSGNFVKSLEWTRADEERRQREAAMRKRELKKKAFEGVKSAAARIKSRNMEIWWSMQPESDRKNIQRRNALRRQYAINRQKEKEALHCARIHHWSKDEMKAWISQAIISYFNIVLKFYQDSEASRPRKPEIFVTRVISEVFGPFDELLISKFCAKFPAEVVNFLTKHNIQETANFRDLSILTNTQWVEYCLCQVIARHFPDKLMESCTVMDLVKEIIRSRKEEETILQSKGENLLIISPEQLHFKRLSLQANDMVLKFSTISRESIEFVRTLEILDRTFARQLSLIFATSILHRYENDKPLRDYGERVASSIILAFMRMLVDRKKYQKRTKMGR